MEGRIGDPAEFALLLQTLMDESPVYKNPTDLEPRIAVSRQTITRWLNQEAQIHPFRAKAVLQNLCEAFELDAPISNDPQREMLRQARRKGLYHFAGYPLPEEPGQTSAEMRAITKPFTPPTQTPDQGSGRWRRPARLVASRQEHEAEPHTEELKPIPPWVRERLAGGCYAKKEEEAYIETI